MNFEPLVPCWRHPSRADRTERTTMTNPRPNLLVAYLATPGGEDALALGA